MKNEDKLPRVGVLVGSVLTDHSRSLLQGIYDALQKERVEIHTFMGAENANYFKIFGTGLNGYDYQYDSFYEYAYFDRLDVVVLAGGTFYSNQSPEHKVEILSHFPDIPRITPEERLGGGEYVLVNADNYGGIMTELEHIYEVHGRRKILFFAGPVGNSDSEERLRAYHDFCEAHGLPHDDSKVGHGNFSEFVRAEVDALLDANPDADAIASANDRMATTIYEALRDRGLEPGRDVSVTGFDDINGADLLDPPMTTVEHSAHDIGFETGLKIKRILANADVGAVNIPTHFIRRASCGCADFHATHRPVRRIGVMGSGFFENPDSETSDEWMHWKQFMITPIFMHEMLRDGIPEDEFFRKLMGYMNLFGAKSSYLYLLDEPMIVSEGSHGAIADAKFSLVASQSGSEVEIIPPAERKPLNFGDGFASSETVGKSAKYLFTFLLSCDDRQYGVISLEIDPNATSLFYVVAVDIGTGLRFKELNAQHNGLLATLTMQNDILQNRANYDPLTRAFSRGGLEKTLEELGTGLAGHKAVVALVDLDHLKQINDRYGHMEGDFAIENSAEFLKSAMGDTGSVGRIGGDEFMGVVPLSWLGYGEDEDEETLERVIGGGLEYCADSLNETSGKPYFVEVSYGIKVFELNPGVDVESLINITDEKLYADKQNRRESITRADN